MTQILAATDAKTLQTLALGVSGASLVIAIVLLMAIKSIVGKIISLAIFLAISVAGYTQRAGIADCADKVKAQASAASINTACTFFGQNLTIKVKNPTK